MAIRFFKAATPGTRHGSVINFSEISSKKPEIIEVLSQLDIVVVVIKDYIAKSILQEQN